MRVRLIVFYIFCIVVISACSGNKEEITIAKVFDKSLYISDIENIIPPKTSAKDSTEIVKNYINNWVRLNVLLKTARENVSENEEAFNKQMEDYKNSLIIYAYETELVKQKLDTNVTDKEIAVFYENHKDNFALKENIVKVIYAKLPSNSSNIVKASMKQLITNSKNKQKLIDYCQKHAVNFYYDDETWLFFNDLLREIPIQTYNQENYLQNNRIIDLQDTSFYYILNILDFKIRESISPLSFEKENIKNIILNKRKNQLINNIHNRIYNDAIKNKDIELFDVPK